ncbi:alginate lyase family protein [Nocardioides aurantiacus]|uniref:alginate lyase family protein n=1 Tax=Nocardioides aurantiacus TaxID=86796 RepID=UPI00403F2C70
MTRLSWYLRRLGAMGPTEVVWRAWRLVVGVLAPVLDRGTRPLLPGPATGRALGSFRRADGVPVLLDQQRAHALLRSHPVAAADVVAAAERVITGRVRYFGYPEVHLDLPVDWSRDGVTGVDWPDVPARRLDHRSAPADPKWVWELNRLQHLPWLAQAYLFTGREEFAQAAVQHLGSWLEQNPVGRGIAWRGAFEAGVRAISVAVALQGLRGSEALTPELYGRVREMLRTSARTCWRERSRFSSANNHLVGEMAGLAVVAMLFPDLPEARRWRRRALRVLEREADRQILPDGAGAEQAVGYQVFTAELLLVVAVLARAGDVGPRPVLDRAVARSAEYLAGIAGTVDPQPRYGDDDEGFALRLGPEQLRTVRDHLGIVAAVASSHPVTTGGLTAAWVQAATSEVPGRPLVPADPTPPGSLHAAHGGLVVLRHGARRLTVDVAPLGYLAIAAHGHADALALTFALDGEAVVDDPGTGSYYGHPEWRRVHRSTPAHATLTVDGQDQSVIGGAFLWKDHARVRLHEVDLERGVVDAEHDGYRRLAEPVVHRRRVEAPPGNDGFLVLDVVIGLGEHEVSVSWPLPPHLGARPDGSGHVVTRDGADLFQVATAGSRPVEHRQVVGDEESHLGWWSDRLESRRPSYLLRTTARGPVPLVLVTVVRRVGDDGVLPVSHLQVRLVGAQAQVSWQEGGAGLSTTLDVPVRGEG